MGKHLLRKNGADLLAGPPLGHITEERL